MVYQVEQVVPILAGKGAISALGEKLSGEFGATKVVLVSGPNVTKAGLSDKVQQILENHTLTCVTYHDIERDAPDYSVDKLGAFMRDEKCDAIVAVGGGSTLDTAKGAGIVACNGGTIRDYMVQRPARLSGGNSAREFDKPIHYNQDIPLIMVPTTAGSGSEMRLTGIIYDTDLGVKDTVVYVPKLAVQDPEMHITMPPYITATTAFDALAHASESMTSVMGKDNLRNLFNGSGVIQTIFEWLPISLQEPENLIAREKLAVASSLAGLCSLDGLAHIGHNGADTLNYNFDIPHAHACALVLPSAIEMAAPFSMESVRYIARAQGIMLRGNETAEELGAMVADRFRELARKANIPRLKDRGIKRRSMQDSKVIDDMFLNQKTMSMFPGGVGITRKEAEQFLLCAYDK